MDRSEHPGVAVTTASATVKDQLAAGYLSSFRVVEITSIIAFFALFAAQAWRLAGGASQRPVLGALAFLLGWVGADFVTGLAHWAGDTWGTPEWPVLGPTFIRPFREHHVDEKAITRHDFVEVNGANCLVSLPILGAAYLIPVERGGGAAFFGLMFLVSLVFWVFATNQIHKWAHQDAPSALARALQRAHLVLRPTNHSRHHGAPYDRYYCITTGWLNAPLAAIGFYRISEAMISAVTGAIPRASDVELTLTVAASAEAESAAVPSKAAPRAG